MSLIDVSLPTGAGAITRDMGRFLREADRRVGQYLLRGQITGFVPSDYEGAYHVLRALANTPLLRGTRFCEWGSGFGVVACLAAGLGYDSHGIESEGELVDEARVLADDFSLEVEFVHGSFVPRGGEDRIHASGHYSWLATEGDYAYEELGLEPDDFDLIFAYPWPDEEEVTGDLFDRYAGTGALLMTYHGGNDFRLRRKATRKSSKR